MSKYGGMSDNWKKFKDKKEKWDKIKDLIPENEPPPDWLIPSPWNPDIWIPNDSGVEPGDCERWPQSCDGLDPNTPWEYFNPMPGFKVETSYSNCSICLHITLKIGPIEYPPYTICYVRPNCEEPKKETPTPPNYTDPTHPGTPNSEEWPIRDYERLIYFLKDGAESVQWNTTFNEDGSVRDRENTNYNTDSNIDIYSYNFVRFYRNDGATPLRPPFYGYLYGYPDGKSFVVRVPARWQLKTFTINYNNDNWNQIVPYLVTDTGEERSCYWTPEDRIGAVRVTNGWEPNTYKSRDHFLTTKAVPISDSQVKYVPWLRTLFYTLKVSEQPLPSSSSTNRRPTPTPSPQIMPNCCDLEPILKAIKKLTKSIDRIEKTVAPNEFYKIKNDGTLGDNIASIPKRFIYPLASGQMPIKNLPDLIEKAMLQIDRYMGSPSWEVIIKDSDPNTPGDQTLPIQVHSTNDGLKAILQFLIDQSLDKNSPQRLSLENIYHNQKALVHMAYEIASTKKLAIHNNYFLQNIEDHLGYKVIQKKITVPFAIDPFLNNVFSREWKNTAVMSQMFRVKNHQIVVTDNVDKVGLDETLIQIGKNAAIAASPHVYQYKEGIVDKLVDAAQLGTELTNTALLIDLKRSLGIMTKDEMKDWRKDAEKAYTTTGGNTEIGESIPGNEQNERYYGLPKPIDIKDTTKRSRRRNRRRS